MDETKALIKSYFGCKTYEDSMMGSYGLSKALLNVYTRAHALASPGLVINACSPGFIATDLTIGTSRLWLISPPPLLCNVAQSALDPAHETEVPCVGRSSAAPH